MSIRELENLVGLGLEKETASRYEYDGLISSAKNYLNDARNTDLTIVSRFILAYSAAHGYATAALRRLGYRSKNRYIVFQCLTHTVTGIEQVAIRIFGKGHTDRNEVEYSGNFGVGHNQLNQLIDHTIKLEKLVIALDPPP